jgi:hypothetical protein
MFNMFISAVNENNVELIDLNQTFSNFNGLIISLLVVVFALATIGSIVKGENIVKIISGVIMVGLVIFLIMNPDKFSLIGEKIFNIIISLLETVKSVKNTNVNL